MNTPVIYQDDPFSLLMLSREWREGETLSDIALSIHKEPAILKDCTITIDGTVIKRDFWHVVRPKPGTRIVLKVLPRDSNVLRTAAFIGLAIIAPQFGVLAGSGYLGGLIGSTTAFYVASAGVFAIGSVLVNALIPPSQPKFENGDPVSQSLSIGASRNRLNPFGVVPLVYGTVRYSPPFAAKPYTELVGADQYVRMLFAVGFKPMELTALKLGETDINQYNDLTIEYDCGTPGQDGGIKLFPGVVDEQQINTKLGPTPSNWTTRTSAPNADELGFDVSMPQGLFRLDSTGDERNVTVNIEWRYRAIGAPTWITGGTKSFTAKSGNAIRWGTVWPVANGQYEIGLRRTTFDTEPGVGNTDQIHNDDVWFSILRTFTSDTPVNDPDIAKVAIRIRASNQLSGVPDEFNLIGSSWLPDWNGANWVTRKTQNPASVMRSVLTGPENARALDEARLDPNSWEAFHDYCVNEQWAFNQVIDFNTTVADTLRTVGASARARISQPDGLWSVVIDEKVTPLNPPVYTPRNSRGFKSTRVIPENVHAFRCRYINEQNGLYQNDERIVYADGYDASNATRFESLELTGVTDANLIYRHARYYLAIAKLQPETFALEIDAENLVCQIGDYIEYQQDALLVGYGAARIKAFDATTITLDGMIAVGAPPSGNALQIRNKNGEVFAVPVSETNVETDLFTVISAPTTAFSIGDVTVVGELGRLTLPLLVKGIRPGVDLSATLSCVPYSDGIYTADSGPIPPYDPHITQPVGTFAPIIQQIVSDESVLYRDTAGNLQPQAIVTLGFPQNRVNVASILLQFRIKSDSANVTQPWVDLVPQPFDAVDVSVVSVTVGETYEFRAKYNFINGLSGPWSAIAENTIVGKTTPPPNLDYLNVTVGPDGTRYFDFGWNDPATAPADLGGFIIRYADADVLYPLQTVQTGVAIDRVEGGVIDQVETGLTVNPPSWGSMTDLKVTGIITEGNYESGSAPFDGNWWICAKAVDTGGRQSTDAVCLFKNLPLPRVGNTLIFRSEFNNNWGQSDIPPAPLVNCNVANSGYLVPDDLATWSSMGTWESTPWASNPVGTMIFENTLTMDPAVTLAYWDLNVTYDQTGGASLVIEWYDDDGGPFIYSPGSQTNGNVVRFVFTLTNPEPSGLQEIIYQAFDATGNLVLLSSSCDACGIFKHNRRVA